jgi:hypothetical protein
MNGYATLTADEHEQYAVHMASMADFMRTFRSSAWDLANCHTLGSFTCQMMAVRAYQNLAVLHMEDAQRIRNQA